MHVCGDFQFQFFFHQFIVDRIDSDPVFKADRVCQLLILEALKHHLLPDRGSFSFHGGGPCPGGVDQQGPNHSLGLLFGLGLGHGGGSTSQQSHFHLLNRISRPRKSTVGSMFAVGCVESSPKGELLVNVVMK